MKYELIICCTFHVIVLTYCSCPVFCDCLKNRSQVICRGNGSVSSIPQIGLDCIFLNVFDYNLSVISKQQFLFALNLTGLILKNNSISQIEQESFGDLKELRRLDLSSNLLTHLSCKMFAGLENLVNLNLSMNRLIQIDGAFGELKKLEVLNLSDNYLFNISKKTIGNLRSLHHLDLRSSRIRSVDESEAFVSLNGLHTLILSGNEMPNISKIPIFTSRFSNLDISHSNLTSVPKCVTSSVRKLILLNNNLSWISDGDFDSYPHLNYLDMSENRITEIEDDSLGRIASLSILILARNRLRKIPTSLPPHLEILNVDNNYVFGVNNRSFIDLLDIIELILSNNKISYLSPCCFCRLKSLKILNLAGNVITAINSCFFSDLVSLRTLALADNPVFSVQKYSFVNLYELLHLDLSRINTLEEIAANIFEPLVKIKRLNVSFSHGLAQSAFNVTRIPESLKKLETLDLSNNSRIVLEWLVAKDLSEHVEELLTDGTYIECIGKSFDSSPRRLEICSENRQVERRDFTTSLANVSTDDSRTHVEDMNRTAIVSKPETKVLSNVSAYIIKSQSLTQDETDVSKPNYTIALMVTSSCVMLLICVLIAYAIRTNRLFPRKYSDESAIYESCDDNVSVISLPEISMATRRSIDDIRSSNRAKNRYFKDNLNSCQTHKLLGQRQTDNDWFVDLT
ncbi:Uncharacterised protein r2_g1095 [Pycnogonum litorale]